MASKSKSIFAGIRNEHNQRCRLNPNFISVCIIRSANSDFAWTRLNAFYFTHAKHLLYVFSCSCSSFSLFFWKSLKSKQKLFDVVFARSANAHSASILYASWQRRKRIADVRQRDTKRKAKKKNLYQMNITIWCVKPITISVYSRQYQTELLLSSIQCMAVKSA